MNAIIRSGFIGALIMVGASAYAGVAPIAGLPDYNGTYYGTPNTGGDCDSKSTNCDSLAGRAMYTTLYRDNYNRESGCAGEGCGSHAGVDIAVASGTPVRAALSGTVVEAFCDSNDKVGYGGLVIIRANNPYVTGKVYLIYAHLDDWDNYAVGQWVTQGSIIGKTGGNPNRAIGVCPGTSGGPHLHFQVDKYPPDSETGRPWSPKRIGSSTSNPDTSLNVPRYTHNPLPFVMGWGYNFTFAEKGNSELWGVWDASAWGVANSALWIDSGSAYAYAGRSDLIPMVKCAGSEVAGVKYPCSRSVTLDTSVFKKMYLNINFKCTNGPVKVWLKGSDGYWTYKQFTYSGAGRYPVNIGTNDIVTEFMVQPSAGCIATSSPYREYYFLQVYFTP